MVAHKMTLGRLCQLYRQHHEAIKSEYKKPDETPERDRSAHRAWINVLGDGKDLHQLPQP